MSKKKKWFGADEARMRRDKAIPQLVINEVDKAIRDIDLATNRGDSWTWIYLHWPRAIQILEGLGYVIESLDSPLPLARASWENVDG